VEWSVNPQNSKVEFEATGGGYTTRGTFGQYKTDIQFDPDAPEQASIRVLFNMKSVKTDSSDADSALQSAEFFNTAQYPTALFVAKGAKPMGDDKYLLEGQLTMKGVTKPVTVPFTIDVDSGAATVKAETRINRMDFGVGPETVAGLPLDKAVKITLNLKALRLDN
jgi:polyisoprenoid-binding protein YceI